MYIKDQKMKEFKNGEPLFKQMIISKDEMKNWKKEELKKRQIIKNSWFDWLINYVLNPIKNCGWF